MATIRHERDGEILTLRLDRAHGNAINDELVRELTAEIQAADRDDGVGAVVLAAAGKLFCPGLDLQELIELDRPTMDRFLDRFNAAILGLYTFSKPLVAAIHGHAVAGGCVLSLTADWRVLRRGMKVGLNEVKVGVPFPFGVSMILRESVAVTRREEVALFGRNYTDEEAVATGLAHELAEADGFEALCLERAGELASRDRRSFAITKRYLRAATVERIRAHEGQFKHEFLDGWFSPETRERIGAIVDGLRARGG